MCSPIVLKVFYFQIKAKMNHLKFGKKLPNHNLFHDNRIIGWHIFSQLKKEKLFLSDQFAFPSNPFKASVYDLEVKLGISPKESYFVKKLYL